MKRRRKLIWALAAAVATVLVATVLVAVQALRQEYVKRVCAAVDREAERLLSEDEADVRAAVAALSSMKSGEAAWRLVEICCEAEAASQIGWVGAYRRLSTPQTQNEARLARVLPFVFEGMGECAVGPLHRGIVTRTPWVDRVREKLLEDQDGRPQSTLMNVAITSYRRIGRPAVPVLVKVLRNNGNDRHWRLQAALALGSIRDPEAIEPLARVVASGENVLAWQTGTALAAFGEAGVARLLPILESTNPDARIAACAALAYADTPEAADALRRIAFDKNDTLNLYAIGRLDRKKDIGALQELLESDSQAVRQLAALGLGRLGNPAALDPLLELVEKPLSEIDPDLGIARVYRDEAIKALGEIGGPKAVDALLTLLSGIDMRVAMLAAEALGIAGDERAVEPLLRMAAAQPQQIDPRCYALLWALSRIDNAQAHKAAADLFLRSAFLNSDEVREILETKGLESFATNWRSYIFKRWAEEHTELFALALEIHGTQEMAREYLECYPWDLLRRRVRDWAELHGYDDLVEQAR